MRPIHLFQHCPRCAVRTGPVTSENCFQCGACGWRYFFNPAAAVAVFVCDDAGRVLLVRRAKDPGRGRLAPPGGFIDFGEKAEDAVQREIREEVGLELADVRFVCSQPNEYAYGGVVYPVLDLFFSARAVHAAAAQALDEVESVGWHRVEEVRAEDLAFPSMRSAFRIWKDSITI